MNRLSIARTAGASMVPAVRQDTIQHLALFVGGQSAAHRGSDWTTMLDGQKLRPRALPGNMVLHVQVGCRLTPSASALRRSQPGAGGSAPNSNHERRTSPVFASNTLTADEAKRRRRHASLYTRLKQEW